MSTTTYDKGSVISLVLLSFILGTSEFIIVGILPNIADDINCTLAMAGNLISVFAFAYAIGTPFFTAGLSSYNRYYTLLVLTITFILGNFLCAFAPNYYILVLARIITAIISGTILSISMTFASEIASVQYQPKVISWIFSGFSIASVFGVPIGTIICQMVNWRMTFLLLSIISIFILFLLWHYLPNVGKGKKSNLISQFALLKSMRINYCMFIVICSAAGSYVFYTYMTPILQQYVQIPVAMTSVVLSLFGISTIISNLISGRIAGLGGMKKMPIVYFLQAICLFAIAFTSYNLYLGLINILIMGVIMYLQNSPAQLHFLKTATREKPEAITLASALNPVSFNTGIALGSACGGIIINFASMPFVGLGGAVFAIIAMIINLKLLKNMTKFNKRG
ncbi:MFS transporter [uncultured Megamonas sp.]|uniref:MFS transporter n=1 Tax=uncultured Megamonas sp. TaxID=286140 RepID=UPI0025D315C1|nr:MFS transporter [uncultured Megamonas sp.]